MKTKQTIIIPANIEYVFDLTQDYAKRKHWDSLMGEIELLTPLPIQKGTQLRYTAKNGFAMTVEYQNYDRPKIASIRIISDSRLFLQFGGGWRFKAIDEHSTEVIFAYSFEVKFLPKMMNPIFAKIFAWENKKRFKKLKRFVVEHYRF